jgi:hypothetical protein
MNASTKGIRSGAQTALTDRTPERSRLVCGPLSNRLSQTGLFTGEQRPGAETSLWNRVCSPSARAGFKSGSRWFHRLFWTHL